jgi:tetratricopeptide (TPR) repeat protein
MRLRLLAGCLCVALGAVPVDLPAADSRAEPTLTELLDRASKRFDRGDFSGARRDYEKATKMDPGSIRAWRGLGWSLWQLGEQERALQVWNDIVKVRPDDPDILLALGQAYESRDDWTQALDHYSKVLRLRPSRRPALLGRARVHLNQERYAEAEWDLRAAIRQQRDDFDAQFMLAQVLQVTGRRDEAVKIYQRLVQRRPDPKYLRPIADAYFELNRPEEAIRYYEMNLQRNPGNRGTVLGLARARAQLHQYDAAITELERFLQGRPEDAKMREELARYAAYTGDFGKSVKHLRVLLRAHPGEVKWQLSLAQSLRGSGQFIESAQVARAVIAAEPDNVAALEILSGIATLHGSREEAAQWLVRLIEVDPSARRWSRLGDLHAAAGNEYLAEGRDRKARAEFREALTAFQRARELNPLDTDAALNVAMTLRLKGDPRGAIAVADEILARNPNLDRARRERYLSYLALEDFGQAEAELRALLELDPGNFRIRQDIARTRFNKGEREAALQEIRALLQQPIHPSVPVLLYHGISELTTTEDTMPLRNFRDQMAMLKKEGYTPITVHQLIAFHRDGAALPPRPVLITFDDARSDSFRYADPVLEEFGLHATMFVPVSEPGTRGPFHATWSTIRELHATGRWDMQCHSDAGHRLWPVDGQGREGIFLANRLWLEKQGRLETRQEFADRLDQDYRRCGETLRRELPGVKLAGYAYPFGELGQKYFSNEPKAVEINKRLVEKHYGVGFIQDPGAEVTRLSTPTVLPRFEVPWYFTGRDLYDHLRSINARTSTQLALADLYSWDGQFAEAKAIFDEVGRSEDVSPAALLTRRGRVVLWQGDLAEARRHLTMAAELEPDNRIARLSLEQLERRTRPTLSVDSLSYSDNRERASTGLGASHKSRVSDRLAFSAGYRYRQFGHDNFVTEDPDADPGQSSTQVDLRAIGNEFEGELAYQWDWRTMLTVAAGVMRVDDRSSEQVFDSPGPIPIGSVALSLPLGSAADLSLRGIRSYVNTAGAVLERIGSTGGEGRLLIRVRDTTLDARYTGLRYDGGNQRETLTAGVFQRIVREPELQFGYRYRYDHVEEDNPLFYTPDRFTGHDAVLRLSVQPFGLLTLGAEGSYGVGREGPGRWQGQASLVGSGRLELADRFSVFFTGGRTQSADFESVQVTAGLTLTF